MSGSNKTLQTLSLPELLQEVQRRASADTIPADQQRDILNMVMDVLQAWSKTIEQPLPGLDMQEIRGQAHVKRALEVAAGGGHNILLIGPKGAGKASLARTLPTLLPTTAVSYPFRMPHCSTSGTAFIGEPTLPGELTLAHGGVLFLENIDAFDVSQLTALRQAVETHVITIPHGEETILFPGHFVLIATVKPCSCGFYGDPMRECICSVEAITEYRQRIEESVETIFDIHIEVPRVREDILSTRQEESSARIRKRVEEARVIQRRRYEEVMNLWVNADLVSVNEIQKYCELEPTAQRLLKAALQQLHLTPQGVLRIQRLARTIADLADSKAIAANHIAEAVQYRSRF